MTDDSASKKAKRKSRAKRPLPWWQRDQKELLRKSRLKCWGYEKLHFGYGEPLGELTSVSESELYGLLRIAKLAARKEAVIDYFERQLSDYDENDRTDRVRQVPDSALYDLLLIAKSVPLPSGRQQKGHPRTLEEFHAAEEHKAALAERKKERARAALAQREEIYVPVRKLAPQWVAEDKSSASLLVRREHTKPRLIEEAKKRLAAKGKKVPSDDQIGRELHPFKKQKYIATA